MEQFLFNLIPDEPITLIVYLGVGYLAYRNAYVGLNQHHTTRDSLFLILIFTGIIGWPAFQLMFYSWYLLFDTGGYFGTAQLIYSTVLSGFLGALFGILWRRFGKEWWKKFLEIFDIREDGVPSAWTGVVQETSKKVVWQVAVHTQDNRTYYMNDIRQYESAPFKGVYFGTDGDVALVVDLIEKNGRIERRPREIIHAEWGTRITYIPAKEIKRIDIRMSNAPTFLEEVFSRLWACLKGCGG